MKTIIEYITYLLSLMIGVVNIIFGSISSTAISGETFSLDRMLSLLIPLIAMGVGVIIISILKFNDNYGKHHQN